MGKLKLKKADWLAIGLLVLVALFGVRALFHPGFYTSHDGEHQIIRLNHFLIGLKDGQIPVRWAGTPALDGFGYPLFIFTYRLPFYLGTAFRGLGFSLVDSIKAVFILTYLLSGVVMYLVQKKVWDSVLTAFLGAVFYLWAPWRFSTILVRASLGEAVSFVFFPVVFWAVWQIGRRSSQWAVMGGALALAGLLLSHGLLTFLFLPFLAILMAFFIAEQQTSFIGQSKEKLLAVFNYFKLLIFGAGISAFYWLPAMVEKNQTVFADIIGGFYRQHFPTLRQLLYSPWGYGLSHPGTELDAMSFQVGLAQWLAVFLAIFLLKRFFSKLMTVLVILFCLTIFLMLPISDFYWQLISRFLVIDFTFRYLVFSTLFSSLIAGGLVSELKKINWPKLFFYPVIFGLLFLVFYGNRNHLRVNQYLDFSDRYYQDHPSSSNSFDEYRPSWVNPKFFPKRTLPIVGVEKEIKILSQQISSNSQKFILDLEKETSLRLNTVYYPGWHLFVGQKEIPIAITPLSGLMEFFLPAGKHELRLEFGKTSDRMMGEIISLFFGGWLVFNLLKLWPKSRK